MAANYNNKRKHEQPIPSLSPAKNLCVDGISNQSNVGFPNNSTAETSEGSSTVPSSIAETLYNNTAEETEIFLEENEYSLAEIPAVDPLANMGPDLKPEPVVMNQEDIDAVNMIFDEDDQDEHIDYETYCGDDDILIQKDQIMPQPVMEASTVKANDIFSGNLPFSENVSKNHIYPSMNFILFILTFHMSKI